jgi:hypothetical protein
MGWRYLDDEALDIFVVAQGKTERAARLHIVQVFVRLRRFCVQLGLKAKFHINSTLFFDKNRGATNKMETKKQVAPKKAFLQAVQIGAIKDICSKSTGSTKTYIKSALQKKIKTAFFG